MKTYIIVNNGILVKGFDSYSEAKEFLEKFMFNKCVKGARINMSLANGFSYRQGFKFNNVVEITEVAVECKE